MGPISNGGTGGIGHMGNSGTGGNRGTTRYGPHRQWVTWAMGYMGNGVQGYGQMGNGAHGRFATKMSKKC